MNKKSGGTLGNSISFLSSLPSNQRQIFNIGPPRFSSNATNKQYVDGEVAKIPNVDTAPYSKIDGSREMTGDLDMDSNFIRNVGIDLADDSTAIPKSYIDARLNNIIPYPITADINLSNFKITNLKTPTGKGVCR